MSKRIQYNIHPSADWGPAQWYNSEEYKVSYKRNYKAASSSIVAMLGEHTTSFVPEYDKRFSVVRGPYSRAFSIYCEMVRMKKEMPGYFYDFLMKVKAFGFYDKHQFPQCFWLEDEDIDKIDFFWLSDLRACLEWFADDHKDTLIPILNKTHYDKELSTREENMISDIWQADFKFLASIDTH